MKHKKTELLQAAIVIPTYNAGTEFAKLLEELSQQSLQTQYKLIIDSSSTDDTKKIGEEFDWTVVSIPKESFSHGGTRQQAVNIILEQNPTLDIVIFVTQDIRIPQRDSLEKLLSAFENESVAAAYGRQIPHEKASVYAAVDREFNYPAESQLKSMADASVQGIKTTFISDSFAAYRVSALIEIGGFPKISICEDMYVGGKLLLHGYSMAYVAEAEVRHSHEPDLLWMWHRYKAMGRFHRENTWLAKNFGGATGEGIKLFKYKIKRVGLAYGMMCLIKVVFFDFVKFIAFKLKW